MESISSEALDDRTCKLKKSISIYHLIAMFYLKDNINPNNLIEAQDDTRFNYDSDERSGMLFFSTILFITYVEKC